MSLQKILEYQKIDIGLYQKEKKLLESDERKIVSLCKKKFIDCGEELKNLKIALSSHYKTLQQIIEKISQIEETKAKLDSLPDPQSEDDFVNYSKKIDDFEKTVADLSKEYQKVVKQIEEVSAKNREINDNMDKINIQYIKNSQIYNEKKLAFQTETKDTIEQLAALQKDIDPKKFERYKLLRDAKKMPAFVCYMQPNCGACGVEIAIEVDKKLLQPGDVAECPHCGRMVYKL